MKLFWAAVFSTTLVVLLGVGLVLPFFLRSLPPNDPQRVMLSFSIAEIGNVSDYCRSLASVFENLNVKATVFFVGKVAELNPDSVSVFSSDVDVGSQTYDGSNITSISDYTLQLEEIEKGKKAVDEAGGLDSRLFKAPQGATDDNIYSLLSRSGILADFSYTHQYNVYQDGRFLKFETTSYDGSENSANFFLSLPKKETPIIVSFENSFPVVDVSLFISKLKSGNFEFVKASDIVGFDLTVRGV